MRVLWLCNVIIPQVCDQLGISSDCGGSWLHQLAELADKNESIQLGVVSPCRNEKMKLPIMWGNNSEFFGFRKQNWDPCVYDKSVEEKFREILRQFQPDIVHIFGTEFPHTLAMVRAFSKPERTVIHIQGLISIYAREYCGFLPEHIIKRYTFRDWIRHDNIQKQREKFFIRGEYEIKAIRSVAHVMGRTKWDYEWTKKINPNIKYHHVQEMMREQFYYGEWKYEDCEKHSVFMSQGSYPLKGLHIVLRAIRQLMKKYPDIHLYVAGENLAKLDTFSKIVRVGSYQLYIRDLIKRWKLEKNVHFTGYQNAQQMKERFLKANVFVSASSIENSPNSIGEAMLLGVPIISSDVGGVSSILTHGKEGYLYPAEQWKQLAYYIEKVFAEGDMVRINEDARKRSVAQYAPKQITESLLACYKEMSEGKEEK